MIDINKYVLLGVLLVLLLLAASCTSDSIDSDLPSYSILVSQSISLHSRINGEKFEINISDKMLNETPEWIIGQPLPLSTAEAVAIAQKEVPKYVKNGEDWEVKIINLQRLGKKKWFYSIQFDPSGGKSEVPPSDDYITIPVLLNGKAVGR